MYLSRQPTLAGTTIGTYVRTLRRYSLFRYGIEVTRGGNVRLEHLLKQMAQHIPTKAARTRATVPHEISGDIMRKIELEQGVKAAASLVLAMGCRPGELLPDRKHFDADLHTSTGNIVSFTNKEITIQTWRKPNRQAASLLQAFAADEADAWNCPVRAVRRHFQDRKLYSQNWQMSRLRLPLFTLENGEPVQARHITKAIREAAAARDSKLPLAGLSAGSLRHTGASRLAAAGTEEGGIRRFGHWSSIAFENYIRTDPVIRRQLQDVVMAPSSSGPAQRGTPPTSRAPSASGIPDGPGTGRRTGRLSSLLRLSATIAKQPSGTGGQ